MVLSDVTLIVLVVLMIGMTVLIAKGYHWNIFQACGSVGTALAYGGGLFLMLILVSLALSLMYADVITRSMKAAIDETQRRRQIQDDYNKAHGIVPKTIIKSVRDLIEISSSTAERKGRSGIKMTRAEKEKEIARLEKQMKEAARMMEYEYAAVLRDQIIELRGNGI